ncbi:MAG: hypothetical protein XXXJIFNMEKO3_03174 [Candidatus Erwinia impunctatus]|nr:hypothetical protein XXXJIFNMEKO_03174 [Culicoides impunctatus]
MLISQTISQTIPRNWLDLYETIWQPDYFPRWVSLFSDGELKVEGSRGVFTGSNETRNIRFTEHNTLGVLDYFLEINGKEFIVPIRVVPNEEGAEVIITLFCQPLLSEAKFAEEVAVIRQDLTKLCDLLTA